MARNGYIIFTVRAHVRGRRDVARPLDDLDGNGVHLLHASARVAHQLQQQGIKTISRFEQAYEVDSWVGHGGTLLIEGGAGPFGTSGHTVNVDTRDRRPYGERDANITPLRAMLAVAPDGHIGFLICERRGARHLKNIVERAVLFQVGRRYGLTFAVDQHVDLEAWRVFTDNATPFKVTSVWRSQRREDYEAESRKMPELKMTAEGALARRLGGDLLGALRRKITREATGSINIRDLTPRDADGYQQTRYEIGVTDSAGTQRTVTIDREQLPQWVYEFGGGRMSAVPMRRLFGEHARQLFSSDYGATLEEAWYERRWPVDLVRSLEVSDDVEDETSGPSRAERPRG